MTAVLDSFPVIMRWAAYKSTRGYALPTRDHKGNADARRVLESCTTIDFRAWQWRWDARTGHTISVKATVVGRSPHVTTVAVGVLGLALPSRSSPPLHLESLSGVDVPVPDIDPLASADSEAGSSGAERKHAHASPGERSTAAVRDPAPFIVTTAVLREPLTCRKIFPGVPDGPRPDVIEGRAPRPVRALCGRHARITRHRRGGTGQRYAAANGASGGPPGRRLGGKATDGSTKDLLPDTSRRAPIPSACPGGMSSSPGCRRVVRRKARTGPCATPRGPVRGLGVP